MKKLVFSLLTFALILSCSKDSDGSLESTEAAFNIAKIGTLSTAVPDASFDLTEQGLYRGIFVSADVSLHGEIVISIKNDSEVSALVMLTNEKSLYFNGTSLGKSNYAFKSKEASFSINLSDPLDVIVTGSDYDSRPINMRIIKDRAQQRGVAVLGVFVDDFDPGFNGTWNYLSWSASTIIGDVFGVPVVVPVFNIDEVVITYDDGLAGLMFTDNAMEPFVVSGAACATFPLPTTPTLPFFTGLLPAFPIPPFGTIDLNEDFAFEQTTNINGFDADWGFGYSLAAGTGGMRTYVAADCTTAITSGFWAWNGKTGTINFN